MFFVIIFKRNEKIIFGNVSAPNGCLKSFSKDEIR